MNQITCPLCGSAIARDNWSTCAACPLHTDCVMVCCPNCGYSMVSPEHSRLVRAAGGILRAIRRLAPGSGAAPDSGRHTLADAPTNVDLQIIDSSALALEHQAWLQAYGVQPGHSLRVLQRRPITIIQVAQDELALEPAIARAITVETVAEPARTRPA